MIQVPTIQKEKMKDNVPKMVNVNDNQFMNSEEAEKSVKELSVSLEEETNLHNQQISLNESIPEQIQEFQEQDANEGSKHSSKEGS